MLDFCGLTRDPSVVAIEARTVAVATASSVQMREPIHQRFIGQWRRCGDRLQPLRQALEAGSLGQGTGT